MVMYILYKHTTDSVNTDLVYLFIYVICIKL